MLRHETVSIKSTAVLTLMLTKYRPCRLSREPLLAAYQMTQSNFEFIAQFTEEDVALAAIAQYLDFRA